jgi:pilus assembly protein Flp/PilA
MSILARKFREFVGSEDGPTATEYAIMLALIIVVCIATIGALGSRVNTIFGSVSTAMDAAGSGS